METIDFQQRVSRKIQLNKTYSDFPKAEDKLSLTVKEVLVRNIPLQVF